MGEIPPQTSQTVHPISLKRRAKAFALFERPLYNKIPLYNIHIPISHVSGNIDGEGAESFL